MNADTVKLDQLAEASPIVYLGITVRALVLIEDSIDEPSHSLRKRSVHQLNEKLFKYAAQCIGGSGKELIPVVQAADKVFKEILKTHKGMEQHVLINLVGHCMNELPTRESVDRKYERLCHILPEVCKVDDQESGDSIIDKVLAALTENNVENSHVIL